MRSLSRVIKAQYLMLRDNPERVGENVKCTDEIFRQAKHKTVPSLPAREVEDIKAEANKILEETEAMVLEIMEKARAEASSIVAEARDEAERLKEEAAREADALKAKAENEGYEDGLRRAYKELEDRLNHARRQAQSIIEEAEAKRSEIINTAKNDIVELAFAIASKIVEKEILVDREVILRIVEKSLELAGPAEQIRLTVNPEDLAMVEENLKYLTMPEQRIDQVLVEDDPRIARGGCLVETDGGLVDARVETRFENIKSVLEDVAVHA